LYRVYHTFKKYGKYVKNKKIVFQLIKKGELFMKKSNKIWLAVLITATLVVLAATFIGAATISEKPMAIINYIVGIIDEEPEGADVNGDNKVNIFDALIALKQSWAEKAYASYISLDDDSYSLDFKKDTFEYTVKLPAGHPAVPQVEAKGVEGVTVEVQQAFLTAEAMSANAYVIANNGKGTVSTYTITFEKTADAGFELQYDDRYTFKPTTKLAEGEAFTFTSSNPEIIVVDETKGEMTAKQVSKEDVTITATFGDITETLVVTEVEKAHVNLFLLTGQSNGQGCYGNKETNKDKPGYIAYKDQFQYITDIEVDGAVYSYDVFPYMNCVPANTFYDMNKEKRTGPAAALGKAFYDLSGEKVVFLQTAYSGAPIQSWLDTETQKEAGLYKTPSIGNRNFYDDTQKAYADLMAYLDANNYEVIRTCNFWWHGGTATVKTYDYEAMDYVSGKTKMTDQEYYDLYMLMHKDMIRDFGLDYDFMILNRIQASACYFTESTTLTRHTDLVPIRASQIALTNLNEDIIMASTKASEYARMYSATQDPNEYGYNFVGLDNVHFNQIGHNATGEEAGTNAFYALKSLLVERKEAEKVEIIDTNGRTRLTSKDTIEMKADSTYRIAGLAYPIYSEDITYSSSNENVATINEFGLITAHSKGYTTITVESNVSGKKETVEVWVYEVEKIPTTYRWEFVDDLNTTNNDNLLTLSPEATARGATESSYTLGGSYTTTTSSNRPDFLFGTPIRVSSDNDWSISWKAQLEDYCLLVGQTPAANSEGTIDTSSRYGCIYLACGKAAYKALRFKAPASPSDGYQIKYDKYLDYNTSLNEWRLEYEAETQMLKLKIFLENTWEDVGEVKITEEYDFTFTNLFGRYSGGGYNFRGTIDYVEINTVQEAEIREKNYRYEFNGNLLSSAGKNDLTLSPDAIARGSSTDSYTLTGNKYTETETIDTKLKRADFLFEKPIRVSNKIDWTIEWRADLGGSSQLLGQSLTNKNTTKYGCIYLAYAAPGMNCLRFKTPDMSSSATGYRIAYGDYKNKNTSLNTWKLEHKADTQVMTLYFKGTSGWETVGSVSITADYDFTFTNLFGTYQDKVIANLDGTVEYVDIYTKETIYQ
jgi:hypothetical protein